MNTLRNIDAVNLPPLTWQAQGDANEYVIKTPDNWLAVLQMNGDPSKQQQESIMFLLTAAPDLLSALEQMLIAWPYSECSATIRGKLAVLKAKGGV